ncbi:bifunctional CAP domain/CAP superfamily [Babesia duncani]|uniref:Bifunctional CAP domain/CAP superfamily n=1 Tax=Babesia duncani TaxID=323732 RepID=A0AAD9PLC6_9APIC|nr:bifunctional CAP domain/CAP superfamily [Babesia duncani]
MNLIFDKNVTGELGKCQLKSTALLYAINGYREWHSAQPLEWNDQLAIYAQKEADSISLNNEDLIHLYYNDKWGSNYFSWQGNKLDEELVARFWYEGHLDYDFEKGN